MRPNLFHLLAPLAAATTAVAQTAVFLPDNAALTQPSSSTGAWRSSTTGFRSQFVYDTSHFTNQGCTGPIVITRMRFRAANASTSAGGSYAGNGTTSGVNVMIGTAKTDYTTPNLTFGFNQLSMQQVLTNATVAVAAGAGTTPGNYVIDIPIAGGFVYDPTQGFDLLIDVDGPAFTGTLPTFATGVSLAASRCTRVSNTPQSAATGTVSSGFAPVVLLDIIGTGGVPLDTNGNPILFQATSSAYGTSCGPNAQRSFGELFPIGTSLDLGTGISFTPDIPGAPTRYFVQSGVSATLLPIGPTALQSNAVPPAALTDDTMSQACQLPFAFPFPGGSTTIVHANTNGYITLAPTTATGGDFSPTFTDMTGVTAGTHSDLPRLFPCWYDLYASRNTTTNAAAGLYFDVDTVNNKAYLTWNDFGELSTSTAGAKSFNFQVELASDGSVVFRYGAMSAFGSTTQPVIVGWSPGGGVPAPTSRDISATVPFLSAPADLAPLALAVGVARIGNPVTFTTNFVPVAPGVTLNFVSPVQLSPGLDLGPGLGLTGCFANVDPNAAIMVTQLLGAPSVQFTATVPNNISLAGQHFYSQSAALAPGFNPGGAITSNGIALVIGTVL